MASTDLQANQLRHQVEETMQTCSALFVAQGGASRLDRPRIRAGAYRSDKS
ncbi:hypothetical protein [Bradyrhizobium frederickii]|uniref:hypothetical protein n=1 Tax=Bradyrhizobium frederickii TaxID=2560054 RepID=UPI0014322413|nr:hypothetical protein [Bradyrhizobium frederickii]